MPARLSPTRQLGPVSVNFVPNLWLLLLFIETTCLSHSVIATLNPNWYITHFSKLVKFRKYQEVEWKILEIWNLAKEIDLEIKEKNKVINSEENMMCFSSLLNKIKCLKFSKIKSDFSTMKYFVKLELLHHWSAYWFTRITYKLILEPVSMQLSHQILLLYWMQ